MFSGITGCSDPGQGELHCIQPAETIYMSVDIDTQSKPGACCSECSCSGDPHCYAFGAKTDDFIVCDGRDTSRGCDITKAICDTQKDQLGNPCIFNSRSGSCDKDPLTTTPTMLFFESGSTAITLSLGDRGIITEIVIRQVNPIDKNINLLSLTAADCINNPKDPWVGIPIGILRSEKNGKIWKYLMIETKSLLTVNCVAFGTAVRHPRLDVSIIDTTSTPGGIPVGVKGFCGTGKIDKLKATSDVTDAIRQGSLCSNDPIAETAKFFNNNKPVTNVNKVIKKFCQKYMGDVENTATTGTKACADNITKKDGAGWAKVFCTANTVVSKDVAECDSTKDCKICTTDIEDFGWEYAIEKWDATKVDGPIPGATCIKISDLPPELLECERGIEIQYLKDGTWNTYAAIPSGYTLCPDSGTFNSVDDPELFQNSIRFNQCGSKLVPPGTCPNQLNEFCDADDGFVVTLTTVKKSETPQLGVVELVDDGSLICNPKLYPNNPNGCFSEPLDPCPTCTGKCKPTGFESPCDKSPDACETCPAPLR